MKKTILLMLLTLGTTSLLAGETKKESKESNQPQRMSKGESCQAEIQAKILPGVETKIKTAEEAGNCERLAIVAGVNGDELDSSEARTTLDGKITCIKKGGFTADYASCKRVSLAYDAVLAAETAMFAAQKIALDESNIKANKEVAAKTAAGDGQNAAIDATISRNQLNKKLYMQQATTYASAVTFLSAGVSAWKGKNSLVKDCENPKILESATSGAKQAFVKLASTEECKSIVESKKDSSEVFANQDAKKQFMLAVVPFLQKAAEAKKRAGMSEFVADKLKKIPQADAESDLMIDPCLINANAEGCMGTAGQGNISSGNFQGSSIGFGSAPGSNVIDLNPSGTDLDEVATAPGTGDSVADAISPFQDQAKAANGILDPAAAASMTPGGGDGSAAGGGGGGGGGGGSASLGDDLAGAEADGNKDPDIKTTNLSGKYKNGKASGFSSVAKGGKDDANPFASLFDGKGEGGGIEEDRSIASDTGEGSGLFQKISKKYGQIQQEKRLDSQTLE